MKTTTHFALAAASLSIALGANALAAVTIFDTGTPDGGFLGYVGYDISTDQRVGVSFTPSSDYTLDNIGLWMMSNDFDNAGRTFTVSLRTSDPGSNNGIPSGNILESWNTATSAVGWSPVLDSVTSSLHPLLSAGTQYWIVLESSEIGGTDPLWTWSGSSDPYVSAIDNSASPGWNSGVTYGSAPGAVVNATPVPAPSAAALFGLGGLLVSRRRR